ncbi:MBL fold metallo-hydrolase [Zongyangia hominis]|uniref:MBL fold metallo-hydrolase n=1 Tax=Zongyangia hominis TaxID=2763677 RepID=A0A926ECP7_9FIRM|nr:MBL fold metallo-hydrolase [Zongyangia hominis]MBC8569814.1 MBL fold metallo-hydrolase [Zongyangia hominis]
MEIVRIPVGYLQENCYIVYDEEKRAAVVDPGDEAGRLLQALEKLGVQVEAILLTHGHYDHTGAVPDIQRKYGAKLCIAKADAKMIEDLDLSAVLNQRWKPGEAQVDRFLVDGDVIEVGKLRFDVIATPGHSKGSVTYRCGDTLFTGDTLFQGDCGRTDLYGGSYDEIKASLKKLAALEGDYRVLPGHGPESTLEEERLHNVYIGTQDYDTYF